MDKKPRILDVCCGTRAMWFDPDHPLGIFGDRRHETITVRDRSHGRTEGKRVLHINPDVILDFRTLPFTDEIFTLVTFDPPHLKRAGEKSWMKAKYGKLSDGWQEDLKNGFAECFRVLKQNGVLVFKWSETQIRVNEVLSLISERPLFGQVSGLKGMTHWLVFMKPAIAQEAGNG